MTDEAIRKIEEVAALDGSVAEMAFYANVHVDTVYAHLKENKEFSDRISALRERPVLLARQTVVKSISSDPDMAMKYLERKRRKEFATRVENSHDGEISIDTTDEILKKYENVSDEALKEFADIEAKNATDQARGAEADAGKGVA